MSFNCIELKFETYKVCWHIKPASLLFQTL
jgi:hypothetical protein